MADCKGESFQHKKGPCNRKLWICLFQTFMKIRYIVLVKGTVIQLIYCAYYSKEKTRNSPREIKLAVKM